MVNVLTRHRSWQHTTTLSSVTLDLLFDRHRLSLIEVCIDNVAIMESPLSQCTGLTVLEIDIDPDVIYTFGSLIVDNISSLKHLKLGCERVQALDILDLEASSYVHTYKDGFSKTIERCAKLINGDNSTGSIAAKLNLHSLHVIGLDPEMLLGTSIITTPNMNNLQSLSLESCSGCGDILSLSIASSSRKWTPSLRTFNIRQESSTAAFQEHLRSFLSSFSGLTNLSVLLTGSSLATDPDCFIKNHGATLKTLVWDHRSEPRQHLHISTHHQGYNGHIEKIAKGCPILQELGISDSVNRHPFRVSESRSAAFGP